MKVRQARRKYLAVIEKTKSDSHLMCQTYPVEETLHRFPASNFFTLGSKSMESNAATVIGI